MLVSSQLEPVVKIAPVFGVFLESLLISVQCCLAPLMEYQPSRTFLLKSRKANSLGCLVQNGAGKTTTVRLLLGLIAPDAGTHNLDEAQRLADIVGIINRRLLVCDTLANLQSGAGLTTSIEIELGEPLSDHQRTAMKLPFIKSVQ